ncbi:dermonecrotic toxin LcsSicTox-betaIC1-like [Lineus longissimus]|uniref:dermonecrotic toxin LcsSicTox-betaIC1-like n=1 Tax=Lineus longissimus TaxID=88925 RepID=UPI002B4D6164
MRGITCAAVLLTLLLGCSGIQIRPLYIAGFMANSIEDVDAYIAAGANVVEADLYFDKNSGHATEFYKGTPCDCFRLCGKRENIITYLQHIQQITTPGHPKFKADFTGIVIINALLDTTSQHAEAGKDMASLLRRYLFSNPNNAKIVFDISHPTYWSFVDSLVKALKDRQREDILPKIGLITSGGKFYSEFIQKAEDTELGLWMGDGMTNCLEDFFSTADVKEGCRLRDEGRGVSKVIRWTVDLQRNIRNAMWMGVDVIGTNDVHDVLAVMKEDEFQGRYRLATANDDHFARVKGVGPHRFGCHKKSWVPFTSAYTCWKDKDSENNWCNVDKDCTKVKSICKSAFDLPCM